MSKKIYPGSACRLEFIVEDASGLPVPSLAHGDVSSSAYRNRTNGVQSSATTATVTSSVASTAAVSAGQFVTIDSARGHYAIDVASGAAGATLDYAEAVVAFTAGHTVTPIQHEIDETLYEVNAAKTLITTVDSVVDDIHASMATQSNLDIVEGKVDIANVWLEGIDSTTNGLVIQVDDAYQIILSNLDVVLSTRASGADQVKVLDRLGFLMAQEIGACSDPGTATETYSITIDATTYTIDHVDLTILGARGVATLTKT